MSNKYPSFASLVCALLLLLSFPAASQKTINKIVAKVGTEIILLSEIETQYQYQLKQGFPAGKQLKCDIMEGVLIENILLTQADLDSIVIPDDQVEAQLDARMDRILRMMNNDMDRLEQFYGESISQLKNRVRDNMRDQLMVQQMQSNIVNGVQVTPREVVEFYNSIPFDSLPLFNSEVEYSEIVVLPQPNLEEKERSRKQLEDIRQRILDGEDFEELARKYSDDPGSARMGGNLGVVGRGMLVPEYEAAAFSLEEGELSGIVESDYGYHLIQLIARRGNNFDSRHILIKPNITASDREKAKNQLTDVKKELMADSLSFGEAVQKYGSDQVQSFHNGGRVTNMRSGNTFFEIQDIDPPDIFFTIDTMEVGDVSDPIEIRQRTGERKYQIIQLDSRTDPHQADLTIDYSKIQEMARQNKQGAALANWIDDNIDRFYVELDSQFSNCPNLDAWRVSPIQP